MEMRRGHQHILKHTWRYCCIIIILMTAFSGNLPAQDPLYTVKNGKMYIQLRKNLPESELDRFIAQFDLYHLALKRFINKGYEDSIRMAGWDIGMNTSVGFIISKPLLSSDVITDPADRINFGSKDLPLDARFPSVSNDLVRGYNRFRNKQPFVIRDSIVTFYLRNNLKARSVTLAGSFNRWDPEALSMLKTDSGWIANVQLAPGKYWYKFIIDGTWTTDADNRLNENDGLGNTNSVYYFTNTLFRLDGYTQAKKVILSGSFNNWNEDELAMEKTKEGWKLALYLADGTHTYKYIVDKNWLKDPHNPNKLPNEFDDFNSVIAIGSPHLFKLNGYTNAGSVIVAGSFNRWREDELFMKKTATGWELPYVLGPGNYEYKFIVDGKPIADPGNSIKSDKENSYLILKPNYTFHLNGFETAKQVFLAGDFNNWSPNSLAMKKEQGEWVLTVHLSPGKHLYKFIVDGNWIKDPGNKLWEESDGNSVLWIEQ